MGRHFRQLAALAATAFALLPSQLAEAWIAPNRRGADVIRPFDAPSSNIEIQWGSPYYPLAGKMNEDGSIDYVFESVFEGVVGSPINTGSGNKCAAVGMTVEIEPFHKLEGITSADQCQQACGNTMRCSSAVFNGSFSTCELMKKLPGLSKDPTKAVVLPNCDSTCFKSGQKLTGQGISLGNCPNPSICQARCQAEPNCEGFTWTRSNSACMSHSNDSDFAGDDDAVSGPRQSCSSNTKPSDYAGSCTIAEMSDTGVESFSIRENISSYEQCHELCLDTAECNWLTYNSIDRKCYLKPQRGQMDFVKVGDVTGPRFCDSSCFQRNIELTGEPFATFENNDNPYVCHYECSMNEHCQMWSWNTGSKKCFLHGAGKVLLGRLAEGSWSGIRGSCRGKEQHAGSDIKVVFGSTNTCGAIDMGSNSTDSEVFQRLEHIRSADQCQLACNNAARCNTAVFDITSSTCELMKSLPGMIPASGKAVVLPNCDSDCFSMGKELGGEGRSLGSTPNPSICQARCQADTNCRGFTWIRTTLACMSYDDDLDFKANNDAVSGPRESCFSNAKPSDYAGHCALLDVSGTELPDLAVTTDVPSETDCRHLCMNSVSCNWWTYNALDRKCFEKPGRGIIRHVKSGDTTGPRLCDSSCFQKDVELTGAMLATLDNYENPHSCNYECLMNSRCQNWSWTAARRCFLYGSTGISVGRLSEGSWSGIRGSCGYDTLPLTLGR